MELIISDSAFTRLLIIHTDSFSLAVQFSSLFPFLLNISSTLSTDFLVSSFNPIITLTVSAICLVTLFFFVHSVLAISHSALIFAYCSFASSSLKVTATPTIVVPNIPPANPTELLIADANPIAATFATCGSIALSTESILFEIATISFFNSMSSCFIFIFL